jgi:hypothetical protein
MDPTVKYLSHCAALFQICGHQFFSVKTLSSQNLNQYPSLFYSVYFIFVFVALTSQMVVFALFASSDDIEVKLSPKTVLNYVVQHSMYVGLILIICVSAIQSYFATPLTRKIFWNCIKIARMCQEEFSYTIDHRLIRRKVFAYFTFVVSFKLFFDMVLCFFQRTFEEENVFARTFFAVVPLLYMYTTSFKFIFYVKLVNYQLLSLQKLVLQIPSAKTNFPGRVGFYVKTIRPNKSIATAKKIVNLRKIFNVIYDNSEFINRSMGITVLTIVAVMVIVITASGYVNN